MRRLVDRGRRASRRGVGLDRGAVGVLQVHRRHEVEVGVDRVGAGVDQDHADAAGLLDGEALVDAGGDAAVADDDLAGHLGGVEDDGAVRLAVAERELRRVGAGQAGRGRSRSAGAGPTAVATRGAGVGHAVAQRHGARRRCGCGCRRRPSSATGRDGRRCWWWGRCCRRTRRRRCRHRPRTGTRSRPGRGSSSAAADREVDDVHAVGDGLVDGGDAVGVEAAAAGAASPSSTL